MFKVALVKAPVAVTLLAVTFPVTDTDPPTEIPCANVAVLEQAIDATESADKVVFPPTDKFVPNCSAPEQLIVDVFNVTHVTLAPT